MHLSDQLNQANIQTNKQTTTPQQTTNRTEQKLSNKPVRK